MPYGTEVEQLAGRWTAQHERAVFAALADALRKQRQTDQALAVLADGLERFPAYLPGHVALARVRRDAGDLAGALDALSRALQLDPRHPMALAAASRIRATLPAADPGATAVTARPPSPPAAAVPAAAPPLLPVDGDASPAPGPDGHSAEPGDPAGFDEELPEPLLTESLAVLYHRQGHHDRALEVFDALLAREPANGRLQSARDAVHAEMASRRPRPYDAATSGGRSVAVWLSSVAASRPDLTPPASAYDAFFQEPAGAATGRNDENLEAFQRWLKELGR